jgi:hypothetical protein
LILFVHLPLLDLMPVSGGLLGPAREALGRVPFGVSRSSTAPGSSSCPPLAPRLPKGFILFMLARPAHDLAAKVHARAAPAEQQATEVAAITLPRIHRSAAAWAVDHAPDLDLPLLLSDQLQ